MSFEIALTGINAASTELSTISNNIANNATTGFKRSRAEFADVYAQSASSSSSSNVGQGVRVAQVRQEHTQGDMQFTDRNLDLAVEGLGMFRLNDDGSTLYTRSGNFGLDREGYIVDTSGNKLTGYGVDSNSDILPVMTDLKIDYSDLEPNRSTKIDITANLDSKADPIPTTVVTPAVPPATAATTSNTFDPSNAKTYSFSTSTLVYDSLGSSEVANIYFQKVDDTSWNAYPYVGDQTLHGTNPGATPNEPLPIELLFDQNGALSSIDGNTDGATTFTSDTYTPASGGASDQSMEFDLWTITQFDDAFGVNSINQDGFSAGRLEDFDVDTDGTIFGRFSNGQAEIMGQVTLSNFSNESGLRQVGATSWTETYASGSAATGAPNSASLGSLQSGALEGSNVDITQELVSMIGAQRSFQANAQVISTNDTLTQTVINIRR
ncbi:flagellar hook protein FlgE [Granulosicoccus antarcticus]|uniref:Flagellar hook protein FlgE n=1 Tax=Granulosicoccus antarcticus IMCC3135 TaxID=1192854 RepID=A0A2Z2NVV6_9GAMM|nr:flagellar hook protein FlgE [Granulosicoccus antarcticus]ASJ71807.1 Flagellar hook protein FlgE [Granulosicoccus antarcticus IMCC3135]